MKQERPNDSRRVAWLVAGALLCLTAAAYSRIGSLDFTSLDDPAYVTRNPHVVRGLTPESVIWSFTAFHSANWHPLTWFSHMVDVELFDLHPLGHHMTSLVLHLANVLLLFALLNKLTGQVWRSGFVAGLFGVHPLHVESVAWVAERKDVLSTLFFFLALLVYVSYVRQPSRFRYIAAVLLLALGLMAKPMLVTAPILMLLLDYWPLGRLQNGRCEMRVLLIEKLAFFVLVLGSIFITLIAQHEGGAVRTLQQYPLGVRVANAVVAYIGYIVKTVLPVRLCALYVHPTTTIPLWQVIASWSALTLITVFAVRGIWAVLCRRIAPKQPPYVFVGWLWYVITLIPVIGLVQVGEQAMADRYTYIPLIGIFIIVAWGIPDLVNRFKPAHSYSAWLGALAAVILVVLAILTWIQVGTWRSGVTLFRNVLDVNPKHYLTHYCLADAYMEENRLKESLKHYRIAMRLNAKHDSSKGGAGYVLMRLGRWEEAWRLLNEVVKSDPKLAPAWNNLGGILLHKRKYAESIQYFRKALRLEPEYAGAHFNLGTALDHLGDLEGARRHYEAAVRFNPRFAAALCCLGAVMFREGNVAEAVNYLREAIRIQPTLIEAHLGLGQALTRTGEIAEAVHHLQIVVRERPRWAIAHYNLALALYRFGDLDGALKAALRAKELGWAVEAEFLKALQSRSVPSLR